MSIMSEWKVNTLLIFNELLIGQSVRDVSVKLQMSERGVYKTLNTHKLRKFVDYFLAIKLELGSILEL
jgi:hypothetical protein